VGNTGGGGGAGDEPSAIVLPLPLLVRFMYCVIASASRSRTRVATGDNTLAGTGAVGGVDTAFVGVCSDLDVPDPLLIDERSPNDALRGGLDGWLGREWVDEEFEG